jgi:hypothetical protein
VICFERMFLVYGKMWDEGDRRFWSGMANGAEL